MEQLAVRVVLGHDNLVAVIDALRGGPRQQCHVGKGLQFSQRGGAPAFQRVA